MNPWLRNFLLLVLMLAASGTAIVLRPTHKIADQEPKVDLETMIPRTFGDWREEQQSSTQIVDPQQQATIDKIYTQTLSRTYVHSNGYRVMLSIAYGSNQGDSTQLHKPEICYPAQGFALLSMQKSILTTAGRSIPVARIVAQLEQRVEPVTYWTTVGNQVVQGTVPKKLAELTYALLREIPDGLLFRVSSIDTDKVRAFQIQEMFITDIVSAVSSDDRVRIAGKAQ